MVKRGSSRRGRSVATDSGSTERRGRGRSRSTASVKQTPRKLSARDAWLYHYADDIKPSLDFFYKPHTLSVLLFLISGLIYYAFNANNDVVANTKAGAVACFGVILITGLLQFRDGPFIRPHPAFWRLVLALSVSYQLILVMILFQDKHTARHLFTYLDPSLGVPLPEKNYANDCTITWQTVYDQMDVFVVAHTVGWFAKSMVLRDEWICWILSILFEFLEYSLQHQLPNFAECWWDHWVLDVLVTNWLGIYIGTKTCEFFACRQYSWRSINQIESYQGKLQRGLEQFTPHSWTRFAWGPSKSVWNFLAVIALIVFELTIELNAFYLKALLWLPPPHFINVLRLFIMFLFCMPATREVYQYLSDPRCKRLGYHAWMLVANVATEALICIKFSEGEFTEPFPRNVIYFWIALVVALIVYAAAQFGLRPLLQAQTEEAARVKAD